MKIWFDTEFIEDGKTIDLISIGAEREDGRPYYAENSDCDLNRASDWVKANVFPSLRRGADCVPRLTIAREFREFCGEKPEFWGYYADYDWVVLCQLYGTMMDLPKGWPMFCMDIKQLCVSVGDLKLPEQGKGEHHALADAKWNRRAYEFLLCYPNQTITRLRAELAASADALEQVAEILAFRVNVPKNAISAKADQDESHRCAAAAKRAREAASG